MARLALIDPGLDGEIAGRRKMPPPRRFSDWPEDIARLERGAAETRD